VGTVPDITPLKRMIERLVDLGYVRAERNFR